MNGWIFLVLLTAVAIALFWRFAKLPRSGVELMLAAMLVGIAGYAWQGHANMAGVPVQSRQQSVPPDAQAIVTRRMMTDTYGDAAKVAEFADTLDRMGLTREAVIAVRTGIRKEPTNPELWVSLGNTLLAHGGGLISPAADLAYARAAQLAPGHPAPAYFRGIALAQSGRVEEAVQMWAALLARSPKDAPWRADVEARLAMVSQMAAAARWNRMTSPQENPLP